MEFSFTDNEDWRTKLNSITLMYNGTGPNDFTSRFIKNEGQLLGDTEYAIGEHIWTFSAEGYEDVLLTVEVLPSPLD